MWKNDFKVSTIAYIEYFDFLIDIIRNKILQFKIVNVTGGTRNLLVVVKTLCLVKES